jgi:hypothetical protein
MASTSLFKFISKNDPSSYYELLHGESGFGNFDNLRYRFGGDLEKTNQFMIRLQEYFDKNIMATNQKNFSLVDTKPIDSYSFSEVIKNAKLAEFSLDKLNMIKNDFEKNQACFFNNCFKKRDHLGGMKKICKCN